MPEANQKSERPHSGQFIYEELRKQILTLKLKPGEPLDEVSLANQFGLSRSPVRNALARLVSEGLVTILPNRTSLVTPFEIAEFPNYVAALDLVQRAVSRLAAINRSNDEMKAIREIDEAYLDSITRADFQRMTELNKEFHMTIARAGHNPYFTNYYERLLGEGQRLLHLHYDHVVTSASIHRLGRDHEDLIVAIEERNADAADRAAHEHTMLFQARFLDYMQLNLTRNMELS